MSTFLLNHGNAMFLCLCHLHRVPEMRSRVTSPPNLRSVLSLLCPCAVRYSPLCLIFVGFILLLSHVYSVPAALPCRPVVSSMSQKCHQQSLCAFDALEAAEVPAFFQTGSNTGQFLSEGAGQPRKKSLHLARVNLQKHTHTHK